MFMQMFIYTYLTHPLPKTAGSRIARPLIIVVYKIVFRCFPVEPWTCQHAESLRPSFMVLWDQQAIWAQSLLKIISRASLNHLKPLNLSASIPHRKTLN